MSNSVRVVYPGWGCNTSLWLLPCSLSLLGCVFQKVCVLFLPSFLPLPLFQMLIAETDREKRGVGGWVDIHLWEKYLGGREGERRETGREREMERERERESKGVGVGKHEGGRGESGRVQREREREGELIRLEKAKEVRVYYWARGETERREAEGRVTKWMQFAVACRQITAKSTGRRTDWTWINKWKQKNWMYTAYEEKIREGKESAFISFYLCIRYCCEEPTERERKIADNSFLPNILRSRRAVSQNRVDRGTCWGWIFAQ